MSNTSPPGVTRPPTVTLTAANIERLKTFTRPPGDNGIGLHFGRGGDTKTPIIRGASKPL